MGRKIAVLFDLLLVVASGLLLAAALLCRHASDISPETGRFWALLALSMPGVLLLNLAGAALLAAAPPLAGLLLPLAALLSNGEYVAAMVQVSIRRGCPDPLRPACGVTSMPSTSIWGNPASTAHAVAGIMSRERVDVLCLQEFPVFADTSVDSLLGCFMPRFPLIRCRTAGRRS